MKKIFLVSLYVGLGMLSSCTFRHSSGEDSLQEPNDTTEILTDEEEILPPINKEGLTVVSRYNVPPNFHRVEVPEGSFAEFLHNLPLKEVGYVTHLYNGHEKEDKISTSVIDFEIDSMNKFDASGAIVRLIGEYLYKTKQFEKISFHLNNKFICDFERWAKGYRVYEKGKQLNWKMKNKESGEDYSYTNFQEYLTTVNKYVTSHTLRYDLKSVLEKDFGVGTIIISDDSPQHVAIVVDMIEMDEGISINGYRDMKGVLLAQGGMPAQEIEIIEGNWDEFDFFPDSFKRFWTTTSYGERFIEKPGGKLLTIDKVFNNKKIYNFE